jgi:putative protease
MAPELLAPAGSLDAALAAFQYGADAVYLGLPRFSARADAENLTPDRLRALRAHAQSFSPARKIYVTCNTLVQDAELRDAVDVLETLDDLRPDGVIVQDLGLARLIREHLPRLALHASTQMAAHNLEGVLALRDLGFTRVVLARELTLDEVASIARDSGVEIEVFVHGALCYSISGLCLFSSQTAGRSGNRGRCAYCCREAFSADSQPACYPFSMRDLALAPILDRVVATGARSLKIEGRMKSPLYVACVTDYYRRKLDGRLSVEEERALVQDLQTIFSRPWTRLYAEHDDAAPASIIDPVSIGHRGAPIGAVEQVASDRRGVRWLRFRTSRALEKHDGLQIDLPDGGKPFGFAVDQLREPGAPRPAITLPAGATVEVALPVADVPALPRGALVYCSASQAVRRRYPVASLRESALPAGRPADFEVALDSGAIFAKAWAAFDAPRDTCAEFRLEAALAPSRQPEQTAAAVRKAFERLGETEWRLGALMLADPASLYAPPSRLNEARRGVLERLTAAWEARRAARRQSIASALDLERQPVAPEPQGAPLWTLKQSALAPLPPDELLSRFETVVLGVGHIPLDELQARLRAWREAAPAAHIRLALPLWTRAREMPALRATLGALAEEGWREWECADLAGSRLLAERGLTPASADWSLYALNRSASEEIARLGVRSYVLACEGTLESFRHVACHVARAQPELLVYQHVPLYISETAPCLSPCQADTPRREPINLQDRRGRRFLAHRVDGRWVTVWESAHCIAECVGEIGAPRLRVDLSFAFAPEKTHADLKAVLDGRCPSGTHSPQAR